jgi:mevalonate kinase
MKDNLGNSTGYAGGKIILLGEHAVVHGKSALAAAIGPGVRVAAETKPGPLTLEIPDSDYRVSADDNSPGGTAIAFVARSLDHEPYGVRLTANFEIPTRAGLGSSAAMAAASARALNELWCCQADDKRLFEAVQASERVFHGNPSGLDAAVVLNGGVILFSRDQGFQTLGVELPRLIVVNTGIPGDTRKTVAQFLKKLRNNPAEGKRRLERIDALVNRGRAALEAGGLDDLGQAMTENHEQLAWFGVSTDKLDRIVELSLKYGALGAKLTGGGGGGCALVLVPGDGANVQNMLIKEGFETVKV